MNKERTYTMQGYIPQLVAVQLASVLQDHQAALRFPQYAALGVLPQLGGLQAAGVTEAEGIDDLAEKAEAFRFGQRCARISRIQRFDQSLQSQAAVLDGLFFERSGVLSDAADIKRVIHALLRRAQLQTHTAKPGYEDINAWLRDYSLLSEGLDAWLGDLSREMLRLHGSEEAFRVFDAEDELIALALRGEKLGDRCAEDTKASSAFGRLLQAICKKDALPALQVQKHYRRHPDFREPVPVTDAQMEEIIRSRVLDVSSVTVPVKITEISMVIRDGLCFVITRTDCGVEGISICGGNWEYFHPILSKKIAPLLIGTDARDIEQSLEAIYVRDLNYKIQGLAYWCCVSWIEMSVLDALGKVAGKPIGAFFGPRCHDSQEYYIASGNRGTSPMEEIEILAARLADVGARAVKFKIGGRMSWDSDSMQGRSEHLIELARCYFGDQIVIHADGNGSFGPKKAIEYGKMLEGIDAYFYEEPCPFDYLWETKEVADNLTIPLAFGEQETSLRRFQWLIVNQAAQVLQPDVQYGGGFIRTCKVARMADLAGLTITPHLSGGIQYAYVLILASFTPNMGSFQELKVGFPETKDFFTKPLVMKDGRITVPEGPGLGMVFTGKDFEGAQVVFSVK